MNKLLLRALSGAVYVVLIVGAVALGTPWFAALMTLFAVLATIEFENILDGGVKGNPAAFVWRVFDVIAAVAVVNLAIAWVFPDWVIALVLSVIGLYTLVRFTLALYDKSNHAFMASAMSVLSLAYIALPLCVLQVVYNDRGVNNHWFVLAMFVMIWLNDTGAFLVGSRIGRHRLFERLSPKKSWEGFFGGFIFCLAAGAGSHYLLPGFNLSLPAWIAFGGMVSVLSTWGDLFESLMKRSMGIKDSGKLIPGHGGILDRIDSLLFVAMGTGLFYKVVCQ